MPAALTKAKRCVSKARIWPDAIVTGTATEVTEAKEVIEDIRIAIITEKKISAAVWVKSGEPKKTKWFRNLKTSQSA